MKKAAWGGLFVVVLAGALLLRTRELGLRPMHHDEANQAVKFGALLETGEYHYDKNDHHGPSLYYLTLPVARAGGTPPAASLDETVLRLVPALFGAGALLLLLLFRRGLGRTALFSGLLAAISPLIVYYSRFYIQETILVFFIVGLLASLWRYSRRPSAGWAVAAGFCAGMMYATKETSIIVFAAVAAAFLFASASRGSGRSGPESVGSHNPGPGTGFSA